MQILINNVKHDIMLEMEIKGIPLNTLKTPNDYYYYLDSEWLYNHTYRNHIGDAITELLAEFDYIKEGANQ